MCEVQTEYQEQMLPDWTSPEKRQEKRAAYWSARCDYLEGKLEALSALTLALVRLISPSVEEPSVGKTTDIEISRKEPVINPLNLSLDTLPVDPPGAPSQGEAAAQFADGWKEMRGTLKCELHD